METHELLKIIASGLLFLGGSSSLVQLVGWTDVDNIQRRLMEGCTEAGQAARKAKRQRKVLLAFLVAFFAAGSVLMMIGYGVEFLGDSKNEAEPTVLSPPPTRLN